MDIEVAREAVEQIRAHAREAHPRECCGILLGRENRIEQANPTQNVHPTPESHFEIDPQPLIDAHRAEREGGPQVIGYYHSHPVGKAEPSDTDAAMAAGDGRIWAIVADGDAQLWRDEVKGFVKVSYCIVER